MSKKFNHYIKPYRYNWIHMIVLADFIFEKFTIPYHFLLSLSKQHKKYQNFRVTSHLRHGSRVVEAPILDDNVTHEVNEKFVNETRDPHEYCIANAGH